MSTLVVINDIEDYVLLCAICVFFQVCVGEIPLHLKYLYHFAIRLCWSNLSP